VIVWPGALTLGYEMVFLLESPDAGRHKVFCRRYAALRSTGSALPTAFAVSQTMLALKGPA